MSEYLKILGQNGGAIVIIVLFVVVLAGIAVAVLRPKAKIKEKQFKLSTSKLKEEVEETKVKGILGTGKYKCMAIRPGNIIDFTTMPEPIGEVYQADTSLPMSGALYIVRELTTGEVVDYDPREVPVVIEESPERAWFAVHWDIVSRVFSIPIKWWQSTSTWFAVGMMVILFICGLVSLGG